jgi:flagellar protein FlgJ
MSIRPPSDLVLDVVRAADPARAAAASARLARAEAMAPAASAAKNPVGQGLEELLTRQLLQEALPKKAASLYGAGTAGEVWRGLFAEHLSHALAVSGRIGLAGRLVRQGGPA